MIDQLDDATAQRILTTIARARSTSQQPPNIDKALAEEFHVAPSDTAISDGELARQSLIVLAEDPQTAQAIESMAAEEDDSQHQHLHDAGTTIALIVDALRSKHTPSASSATSKGNGPSR